MKGLIIAGPTGVGKTDLSLKLAHLLNADIISADSAQVYEEMNIGTAKITKEEMQGITHYMLDVLKPIKKYNVGDYRNKVDEILNNLEKENKFVILTGGTGLYINSICNGLASLPQSEKNIREKLEAIDKEKLFEKLKEVDEEASNEIHPNNKKRVVRALEVYEMTGEKFSKLSKINIKNNNYDFLKVALERDRANLYERINKRVDIMLSMGLEEEVKIIYEKYGDIIRKINIIGYSEFIDYFNGKITKEKAISEIKKNSRNYAKRQFTWFKNDPSYIWYDLDKMSEEEIINDIMKRLKK